MSRWFSSLLLIGTLLVLSPVGLAHKPSDSYLSLELGSRLIEGQWDIALRDLEYALGLDIDGDSAITWGELRARHGAIAEYALARLTIKSGEAVCSVQPAQQLVDYHSDGAYTVLRFTAHCPQPAAALSLEYRLFFDLDPSHRGLLKIRYPDRVQTAVLSPEQPGVTLDPARRSAGQQFIEYWREGGRWRTVEAFPPACWEVAGIVTAFTVAHSITLTVATLGWVSLPSRWVESAIAATVIIAALNNLYPLVQGRRWLIAFCLGLVHGFGFASVLTDLGLPSANLALALAGFNLGVETGQLAIVAGFLPVAFILRGSWFYQQAALRFGSLAVAGVAFIWLLERSLNVRLIAL